MTRKRKRSGPSAARPSSRPPRNSSRPSTAGRPGQSERDPDVQRLTVYGDAAYGAGELLAKLEPRDAEVT